MTDFGAFWDAFEELLPDIVNDVPSAYFELKGEAEAFWNMALRDQREKDAQLAEQAYLNMTVLNDAQAWAHVAACKQAGKAIREGK